MAFFHNAYTARPGSAHFNHVYSLIVATPVWNLAPTIMLDVTLLRFKINHFAIKKCGEPLQNKDGEKQSYNQRATDYENLVAIFGKTI